jgi:hypothetical protein
VGNAAVEAVNAFGTLLAKIPSADPDVLHWSVVLKMEQLKAELKQRLLQSAP